jgi:co-chaperonin GroES (HSP10)
VAPENNVILKMPKAFYNSFTFKSGVMIYFDPMWSPEEYAMLEGTVVSVPRSIIKRKDYDGITLDHLQRGDKVLVRYDVAFAFASQPDKDTIRFKNERWWDQTSYWNADIKKIFCIVRGEERIMLNKYVLCDIVTDILPNMMSDLIIRPESERTVVRLDRARVRAIGENNLDVTPGDMVYFSPNIPQVYSINQEKFIIISERHIMAMDPRSAEATENKL